MAEQAQVTSIEAIEAFRSDLIVYLSRARPLLEDICDEVMRTRVWLQNEQRLHWEAQVRKRLKALENAQQALFSAGMANLRSPTVAEQMAVQRAKHALDEAQEKLKRVKQWSREFDNRVEPLVRQLESLRTLLASQMPKAAATLAQIIKVLAAYTGMKSPAFNDVMAAAEEAGLGEPSETAPDAAGAAPETPAP